jgi:hypothetical protein
VIKKKGKVPTYPTRPSEADAVADAPVAGWGD